PPTSNIQHPTSAVPPTTDLDWKHRLHSTLMEIGMQFTADGVEHSTVAASANELQFTTPEEFMLSMNADDLNQAVRRIVGRPLKIKIVAGQSAASASAAAPAKAQKAPEN